VTRSFSRQIRRGAAAILSLSALLFTSGCGDAVLQGKGSSYLIVSVLQAASGAKPDAFGTFLQSDVVTNVETQAAGGTVRVPSIFEDLGEVSLRMAMKDPTSIVSPSDTNTITIERYHVDYVRSDGRNTQGVDVPYSFDGAVTGSVGGSTAATLTFVIVRAQAKSEAPLAALRNNGGAQVISTLAQVTFYGHDQAGNAVSVTGTISINFADWGDPV
jgi:hypothetical protein